MNVALNDLCYNSSLRYRRPVCSLDIRSQCILQSIRDLLLQSEIFINFHSYIVILHFLYPFYYCLKLPREFSNLSLFVCDATPLNPATISDRYFELINCDRIISMVLLYGSSGPSICRIFQLF